MGRFSPNIMGNYLTACARYNADGEVVTFGDRRVTWSLLRTRVFSLARALIRLGLRPHDKIAFIFHNTPEFVEINYAVQIAGGIPVPLNYRFTALEVERQVNHSDAGLLLYDARWSEAVEGAAPQLSQVREVIRSGDGELEALDLEEVIRSGEDSDPGIATADDDVAAMIYTGGTTGFPKGVMLTYGAHLEMFSGLLASIVTRGSQIDLTEEQLANVAEAAPLPVFQPMLPVLQSGVVKRFLGHPTTHRLLKRGLRQLMSTPDIARVGYSKTLGYMVPSLPFFHDAGYMLLMMGPMVGNLRYVIPREVSFDPAGVLQTIHDERPFLMANVPTGWKKLINCPEINNYDLSSVCVAISGAGVCSVPLKRQIFERFPGVIIIDMFGQTEMTPLTAFCIDADASSLKERSVGKPIVDYRILDEHGADVPAGEVGEIAYRSKTMMKGYYKEDRVADAADGGWFRSGDLGMVDQDGDIRIVDRKKECINTGGEKVFPLEVEEVLALHPAVEAACVIGVPDEEWGHKIRAVVQLKGAVEAQALMAHAREDLAGYKVPREIVFVEELPLSPVGKVLRGKIRELYGAAATTESPGG